MTMMNFVQWLVEKWFEKKLKAYSLEDVVRKLTSNARECMRYVNGLRWLEKHFLYAFEN